MWNKKIIIFGLSAILSFPSLAATSKDQTSDLDTTSDSAKDAAQPAVQTYSGPPSRFDPKTPLLTQKAVKKLLEVDIQKNLLEKKLPEELSKLKDRTEIVTNISFQLLMIEYDRLIKNPELPEVTRIHPKWYKAYGEKLSHFKPLVASIMRAVDCNSANSYFIAVKEFKRLQEDCLAFLKEPAPKISKEQYADLHKANTKRRAQEYEKYLKERRAAELKELQEKRAAAAAKKASGKSTAE